MILADAYCEDKERNRTVLKVNPMVDGGVVADTCLQFPFPVSEKVGKVSHIGLIFSPWSKACIEENPIILIFPILLVLSYPPIKDPPTH